MLTNWLKGEKTTESTETTDKPAPTMRRLKLLESDPEVQKEPDSDERAVEREKALKRKLRENPMSRARRMLPYDSIFRAPTALLMDGHADTTDGLNLNVSRNVHNAMVATKWHFSSPQQSNFEVSLQMNGFSDLFSASYNTAARWQLMYQKTFTAGAVLVVQMAAQPAMVAMGAPPSSFFGLLYYPWIAGGCSTLQYVKSQQFAASHVQQLFRGFHLAAQMTYDITTKDSTMSYAFHTQNSKKTLEWSGEVKPSSGEWKLACVKGDWNNDIQVCTQLEFTEKRHGPVSIMSFGVKKPLIGGGHVQAVLAGFSKIRASLELPFGGERPGFNSVQMAYNVMYDLASGGLKQGMTFTY